MIAILTWSPSNIEQFYRNCSMLIHSSIEHKIHPFINHAREWSVKWMKPCQSNYLINIPLSSVHTICALYKETCE